MEKYLNDDQIGGHHPDAVELVAGGWYRDKQQSSPQLRPNWP